ncbi:MAG: MBL fold metallo-hydrolase [Candidatus Brocadiia bacterium]
MEVRFYGAVENTTGSAHLLSVNGHRVLLECGLFQGHRKEAFERNRNMPFDAASVDVCVLSHAHIDHSGNLPSLVKSGFSGPIYATPATADLCEIMLADSAYLQVQDVEYVNRKRIRRGKNPFEPLYRPEDVPPTMRAFRRLPYHMGAQVVPGVTLTFHDAGHILGSTFVELDLEEDGAARRLMFTGDMGRRDMPILKDPEVVTDVQTLITESTYGNRLHPPSEDVKAKLAELCNRIERDQARLVIPAFSVGRTQQIVYFLNQLHGEGRIGDVPIYVDSPLSNKATEVHRRHPECYDDETAELLRTGGEPFQFPTLTYTSSVDQSKQLNGMSGPVIIISASGMCEGGRILHHLAHTVEHPQNVVLIVGYQAEHTLGRRMVEGAKEVRIFGDMFDMRAQVEVINALSAHADHDELMDYFRRMDSQVERAFVVHGEAEAADQLAADLRETGMGRVVRPDEGRPYPV